QACKFYELFCQAGFKGKCAIVTSYAPQAGDISKEDSGQGATERLRQYDIYRRMLADHFGESEDAAMGKVEQFEKDVKNRVINDYTSGALDGYEKQDIEGLLTDRLEGAREDLDEALEKIRALCEPVAPPKNILQYQQYFCAMDQGDADQLKANEPKRVELYK